MTPRPDIVAIQAAAPIRDLWRLMRETKYSRIPIFGENLDDIVGVVESLGAAFISSPYQNAYGFALVLLILLVRPYGLFGTREVRRV